MVSNDTMEPRYAQGDFVGGIQYLIAQKINECIGHDRIIETREGIFFPPIIKTQKRICFSLFEPTN